MASSEKGRKAGNTTLKKVVLTSFLVDVLDVTLGFFVAVLSGSTVALTEALVGISDLAASGMLFVGFQRSIRKSDKSHPFGYGREMYFWTLIAALVTFGITSTFSIYFGWKRFINPHPIENIWLVFVVLFIALCTNGYAFILSYKRILKNRSPKHIVKIFYRSSLVETKTTFMLDLMGTIAAILGLVSLTIYQLTGDYRLDGIGAMAIGIAISAGAVFLIIGIRDLLIGRSASVGTEHRIRKAALKVREVEDVLGLKTLHIGPDRLMVNLDVHMKERLTTHQLERLIDKIKIGIKKEVPEVKYIQVELETPYDER